MVREFQFSSRNKKKHFGYKYIMALKSINGTKIKVLTFFFLRTKNKNKYNEGKKRLEILLIFKQIF